MKTDLGKGKMRSICSLPKTKVTVKGRPFSLSHVSSLVHRGDNFPILGEGRCQLPLHASVLPTEGRWDWHDGPEVNTHCTSIYWRAGRGCLRGRPHCSPRSLCTHLRHLSPSISRGPVGLSGWIRNSSQTWHTWRVGASPQPQAMFSFEG